MLRVMSAIRTEKLLVFETFLPSPQCVYVYPRKIVLRQLFPDRKTNVPLQNAVQTCSVLAEDEGMLSLRTDTEISYGYRHKDRLN